jgi:hypothetical protein
MKNESPIPWLKATKSQENAYFLCSGTMCYEPLKEWQQVQELLDERYSSDITD